MSIVIPTMNMKVFSRYAGLSLPRHVSYPMPTAWQEVTEAEAEAMHDECRCKRQPAGVSLYIHIPFCRQICRYCACTRVPAPAGDPQNAEGIKDYLRAVADEMRIVRDRMDSRATIRQIHLGGGTPTHLSPGQIEQLYQQLDDIFSIAGDVEAAIEIDPRVTSHEHLRVLRSLGFSRISLGVQDFDEQVQRHVRRIQPLSTVRNTLEDCRSLGFASVNFDLIYGLPYQTPASIDRTIEQVILLSPDRIAFYHYAQIPDRIAVQRGLDYEHLPNSEAKLAMFLQGMTKFESAGYEFIGLDHYARPSESLALAKRNGTLQRTFQGMTTGGNLDLIGLGASSISHLLSVGFLQNHTDFKDYYGMIADGKLPFRRGKRLSFDDRIRQHVMSQLYCQTRLVPSELESQFDIIFSEYFKRELDRLIVLESEGLIRIDDEGAIDVTKPLGRVLLRNIAAVFDAYLDADAYKNGDERSFSANA